MDEYTKGEWLVHKNPIGNTFAIYTQEGGWIAHLRKEAGIKKTEVKANAERICQCVNGYSILLQSQQELVKALEKIKASLTGKDGLETALSIEIEQAIAAAGKFMLAELDNGKPIIDREKE